MSKHFSIALAAILLLFLSNCSGSRNSAEADSVAVLEVRAGANDQARIDVSHQAAREAKKETGTEVSHQAAREAISDAGSETDRQQQEPLLKVLTYNIRHANPPSQPDSIDLAAIVKTISAQQPDLVALQEVDANTRRSGPGNQAELIAEALGMYVFFGKALDYNGGEYGTAILSKYPLSQQRVHKLPLGHGPGAEPRVLVTAKVKLPEGGSLIFGSTHLDHRQDPASRILQVQELVKISGDKERLGISEEVLPIILAGDFNAEPGSESIDLLDKTFTRSCGDCQPTFPAQNPEKILDYVIFLDATGRLEVQSHQVVKEPYASDHLPVSVGFRIVKL